jgi:hypothetical protein
MNRREFQEIVRTQILLIATPGPVAGAVIERIYAAAHEYAEGAGHDLKAPPVELRLIGSRAFNPEIIRDLFDGIRKPLEETKRWWIYGPETENDARRGARGSESQSRCQR